MHSHSFFLALLTATLAHCANLNAIINTGATLAAVPAQISPYALPPPACTSSEPPPKTTATSITDIPIAVQSVTATATTTVTRVLEQFCSTGVEKTTVTATITVTPVTTTSTVAPGVPVIPQGFHVIAASCGADCGYRTPVTSTMTICTACGIPAAAAASPAVIIPATAPKDTATPAAAIASATPAAAAAASTTYSYNPSIPPTPSPFGTVATTDIPVNGQGLAATGAPNTYVAPATNVAPQATTLQRVAANSVSPATPTFTGGVAGKRQWSSVVGGLAFVIGVWGTLA
ncbi:MAG: hypothetical protein M1814_006434 [Vezdaea aestivalis]|nr:MAG: hypothetical protein M1814_006434 [Vezdaea aestivalis]